MLKDINFYLASPFFNDEQIERIEFIEKLLEKNNLNYFSPRKDTYVKPKSSNKERIKAFNDNVEGIFFSDFVIVVTDGKDMGTIFEAGFAYGKNVPIIYFAETLGDNPFNLMLAMSGEIICKSRKELTEVIKKIKKKGFINSKNNEFIGEIE